MGCISVRFNAMNVLIVYANHFLVSLLGIGVTFKLKPSLILSFPQSWAIKGASTLLEVHAKVSDT